MTKKHSATVTITASKAATPSLAALEQIINNHFSNSLRAAEALATIRDQELYRPDFKSFEEYCLKRWGYSRSYACRLADVHEVMVDLDPHKNHEVYPKNEAQARVYVDLDKSQRLELIKKVMKDSGTNTITANILTKLKKQLFPAKYEAKAKIQGEPQTTTASTVASINKVYQSAKKLHKNLTEQELEGDLVNDLSAFIEVAEAVIKESK